MKNIIFRADSSSTIGTGHIMRDLVLAEEFCNANIVFATQGLPGNINHKIIEKNYKIEALNSNDFTELDSLIKRFDINMIVIDHYGIDYGFEKKLKDSNPDLKIFVFDDTYEKHYCDILLNINLYANKSQYKELVPNHCELRCGSQYMLLRDEFLVEKQKGRQNRNDKSNRNVFIAMGGADYLNLNIETLEMLKQFPTIHTNIVTTSANMHLVQLQKYCKDNKGVTLHLNTTNIAKLMNEADFAIITPSVTINEVFYLNVPFISIKTADNQRYMHNYLVENNFLAIANYDEKKFLSQLKIMGLNE